ncbi:hypothetical protein N7475_009093 [Penicillium sp. IBT 31633x]|nr:hypothetical protein N7475_009093 [Penicillium sp. IBT 31633x]
MTSLQLDYLLFDNEPEHVPKSPPKLQSPNTAPTEPVSNFGMALPPLVKQYNTTEQAIIEISDFARGHGYAVSILRSKRTKKGGKKTVRLCCDRGRTVRDRDRIRQTTTILNGCPFAISLRLQHETNTWRLTVENPAHNHEPSPASTHPAHRRRELNLKATDIQKQIEEGIPTC